jgi:hypothetical protein
MLAVVEEDPILAPRLAARKQLKASAEQRVKRVRYPDNLRRSVRIPSS